MTLNRTIRFVTAGVLFLLLGVPAFTQDLQGLQLFAPAEVSPYGNDIPPHEGFFFSFDELFWSVPASSPATIGSPFARVVQSPAGTEFSSQRGSFQEGWKPGSRIEIGHMSDDSGWLVSSIFLHPVELAQNAPGSDVIFKDPEPTPGLGYGRFVDADHLALPMTFDSLLAEDRIDFWSLEVSYLKRSDPLWNGGYLEGMVGFRYIEFNETFQVTGTGGTLGDSWWQTNADNHIPALQIGVRYFKQYGRWMVNAEGRFIAGMNYQNFAQQGAINTTAPTAFSGGAFSSVAYKREWSPGVDLRLEGRYMLTRSLTFRAGWQGIYLDNIARGITSVNYTLPNMGIDTTHNKQSVFMNGLTIGFDINR